MREVTDTGAFGSMINDYRGSVRNPRNQFYKVLFNLADLAIYFFT